MDEYVWVLYTDIHCFLSIDLQVIQCSVFLFRLNWNIYLLQFHIYHFTLYNQHVWSGPSIRQISEYFLNYLYSPCQFILNILGLYGGFIQTQLMIIQNTFPTLSELQKYFSFPLKIKFQVHSLVCDHHFHRSYWPMKLWIIILFVVQLLSHVQLFATL